MCILCNNKPQQFAYPWLHMSATRYDSSAIIVFSGFGVLWDYGMLLSLLSPSCFFFWRVGEEVRYKHVKSQHCGSSSCSQCLHYGPVKEKRIIISRMCDLAVCMVITLLISFRMATRLTSCLFILQLLLQAGDIETNPGPPCKFVDHTFSL